MKAFGICGFTLRPDFVSGDGGQCLSYLWLFYSEYGKVKRLSITNRIVN